MAPKKKTQKMALTDFFADTASGDSWADEMDNLPTAPAPKDPNSGPRKGEPGYLDSMPDRGARGAFSGPPREELPIPNAPPYTAFVGNLAFETDEDALKAFFADSKPISVRMIKDPQTGSSKGYGYVEFETQNGLKSALGSTGQQIGGRNIRISVAEAPSSRREFAPSVADDASQWRRTTPLPAREQASAPAARRQGSYNDAGAGGGADRDWGAARGARFTPAPPAPSLGGMRRDSSGPGREREPMMPSHADEANQWRSAKPMAEIRREAPPHQAAGPTSPSMADTEQTWSRGTKLRTPVTSEPPTSGAASPAAEERDWRSSRATSAVPSNDGDSPAAPAAPLERRKLALAPRSAAPAAASPSESTGKGSNIFGSAKPIDTAAREREAAEKLAARDAERRKAREEEAKKESDKAKQLSDDRARAIREAQEKAQAEISGKITVKSTSTQPTGQGGKRQSAKKVGDDGFEVAKGGRRQEDNKPAPTRKESTTRSGFSFAAAAGGFATAQEEEAAEAEGEDVEKVTNGMNEVSV